MRRKKTRSYALVALALLALAALPASAQEARQYKLEAAFLYNFFSYITWPGYQAPEDLRDPTICIYGNDPVEPYLAYVRQKMAAQRALTIRRIHNGDATKTCHLLFARGPLPEGRAAAQTLTISNRRGTLDKGGMIELTREEERIGMKINHTELTKDGFRVSSRLLNLAEEIR